MQRAYSTTLRSICLLSGPFEFSPRVRVVIVHWISAIVQDWDELDMGEHVVFSDNPHCTPLSTIWAFPEIVIIVSTMY